MPVSIHQFANTLIVNTRDKSDKKALKELWAEKPCILIFLRRLGCPLCRTYANCMDTLRPLIEKKGGQVICLSFEFFGEGSDEDRTFEKYGFWNGPLYTIDKSVYAELFGRKGFLDNLYGLLDMNKDAVQKAKQTPGNYKGDGFQLGGQFVINTNGDVLLDHRQKLFGDDATFEELYDSISTCLPTTPNGSE